MWDSHVITLLPLQSPLSPAPPRPHPIPQDAPEAARNRPTCTETDRIEHFASSLGWGTGAGFVGLGAGLQSKKKIPKPNQRKLGLRNVVEGVRNLVFEPLS